VFWAKSDARMKKFVRRSTYVPFRRYLGDVRREFLQRLFVVRHCTLGSYLDALQESGATHVACLPAPRAHVFVPIFFSYMLVDSTTLLIIIVLT
jgi:hypothetical protein